MSMMIETEKAISLQHKAKPDLKVDNTERWKKPKSLMILLIYWLFKKIPYLTQINFNYFLKENNKFSVLSHFGSVFMLLTILTVI
jgi:hypothetical protein